MAAMEEPCTHPLLPFIAAAKADPGVPDTGTHWAVFIDGVPVGGRFAQSDRSDDEMREWLLDRAERYFFEDGSQVPALLAKLDEACERGDLAMVALLAGGRAYWHGVAISGRQLPDSDPDPDRRPTPFTKVDGFNADRRHLIDHMTATSC
jgi:hypothetical protein